ncbi:MAG TPA: ABC transporter substrate-binding protein [Acidimicrobiia bacterium]|jgi:branched-chain amino acid transport system substrate-binding protein|nr:ABC transporter substrate-binding protein [Acidimicrobiia bacterium]
MKLTTRPIAVLALVALLGGACGDNGSSKKEAGATAGEPAAATAPSPESAPQPDAASPVADAAAQPDGGSAAPADSPTATPAGAASTAEIAAPKPSAAPARSAGGAAAKPGASGAGTPGAAAPGSPQAGGGSAAAPTPGAPGNPGAGGAPNGGATDVGVTATSIKVGHICICTGPVGGVGDDLSWAGQATMKWYNDNGGINGRKLDVLVRDDQWDGTKGMNAVRDLVEREKVFGFSASQTVPTNDLMGPYVTEKKVPNVGGDGWGEAQYGFPWQYPTGNSATVDGYVLADYTAKTQGAKTASIFYFDSPQGRSYVKGFTKQFEKNGGKVVFSQPGTFDDPATATYVARSRAENVDVSTFWGEPGLWVKMIREAASQAYRPKFGFQGCACNYFDEIPGLAGPWAEGSIATTGWIPNDVGEAAGTKMVGYAEYKTITEKYFPKLHHSNWTKVGFTGARLFGDTLKKLGLNVTRQGLKDALDQVRDFDLGLGAKVRIWPNSHRANHTVYLVKLVKDEKGTSGGMRWKYLSGPHDDPVNTEGNDAPLKG